MGQVVWLLDGDSSMVARASEGPNSKKFPRIHQARVSLFSAAEGKAPCPWIEK